MSKRDPQITLAEDDPFRRAIAEAIKIRTAASAEHATASKALDDFDDGVKAATRAFYAADDAVTEARNTLEEMLRMYAGDEVAASAHAVKHGKLPMRQAIANAEEECALAKDRRRLAQEGRVPLAAQKLLSEEALRAADDAVVEAIKCMEQRRLPELVEEAKQLQNDLNAKRAVIYHLAHDTHGVFGNTSSRSEFAQRVSNLLNDAVVAGPLAEERGDGFAMRPIVMAAVAPWQAAREALKSDATAALPA